MLFRSIWFGIVVPARTPEPIINQLHAAIGRALQSPDLRQSFAGAGTDVVSGTPAELAALVKQEIETWGRVVREAGIAAN